MDIDIVLIVVGTAVLVLGLLSQFAQAALLVHRPGLAGGGRRAGPPRFWESSTPRSATRPATS